MRQPSPRKVYEEEILDMPPGLERAVLRIVQGFVGEPNAIEKPQLLKSLHSLGFGKGIKPATFERQVRRAIVTLRKSGILLCASSGEGGYYIARDRNEYDAFVQVEYLNKIKDMSETVAAMDRGAKDFLAVRWD